MTYLAAIDTTGAELIALVPDTPVSAGFTPLEWSIIRLSAIDKPWTVRPDSWVQRLLNLFLARRSGRLANERLEALRTMAVLSRHLGSSIPAGRIAQFLAAGFSRAQYDLLAASVRRPEPSSGIGGEILV